MKIPQKFLKYANKVYGLQELIKFFVENSMCVGRGCRAPPKLLAGIFKFLFMMLLMRIPTLNQAEDEFNSAKFRKFIGCWRKEITAFIIRYYLSEFCCNTLQRMLVQIIKKMKRNKVFENCYVVIGEDGTGLGTSHKDGGYEGWEKRTRKDKDGNEEVYWIKRAVFAQVIYRNLRVFLDMEMIQPGEGETTAAMRLIKRLFESYGSRFIRIIVLDALYANKNIINLIHSYGSHCIGRVKVSQDKKLNVIDDAEGLFKEMKPKSIVIDFKNYYIWEAEELTSWDGVIPPLRVVKLVEGSGEKEYPIYWVTTLSKIQCSAKTVAVIGFHRHD